MSTQFISVFNGQSIDQADIPRLSLSLFREILSGLNEERRLCALVCLPDGEGNSLISVLADTSTGKLEIGACPVDRVYPSLTPDCPQAHLFEREIYENSGILPEGHPWLKPVRFPGKPGAPEVGDMDYFRVEGREIHEVGVGPVHAGVIEPGHFRFQCHGEIVRHLEISLGYQHRGIEKSFCSQPSSRQIRFMETASGDSSAGHTISHCRLTEALSGCSIPSRAQAIRALALELERMACHIGDLGALSGDVGFLPTSAYCGRIRGNVLNMTAVLCGNRFSRNLIRPGGVAYDLDSGMIDHLTSELNAVRKDTFNAIELMFDTPSVLARFEHVGRVSREDAIRIGLVGPAGRACGLNRDVRENFASGIYRYQHIPPALADGGDVLSRAMVRWLELQRSFTFLEELLNSLPDSNIMENPGPMEPHRFAVALTEGWRGEICHLGMTGETGRFSEYKIIDPSFHNWFGLALALRDEQISDFPVCNKSFNLSYCGFDL